MSLSGASRRLLLWCVLAAAPAALAASGNRVPVADSNRPGDGEVHRLVLQGHRFLPSELHARADRPIVIELENRDDTAEEFESLHLRKEFGLRGHQSGRFTIKPMPAGRYPFKGEFHADTAQGVLILE